MSEMVDTTDLVEEIELAEEEQHKVNGNFEEVNEDEIQLDENDAIMDMDEEDEEDEIKSPDDYDLIEKSIIEEDVSMRSPEQNNDNEEDIVEGFDDIITEDDNNEEDESELKLNEDNNSVSDSGYNKVNSVESCDKARMDENSSSVRGDDGVGGDESQENSRETPSLQSNGTGGGGGGKRKRDNEELIEEIYDDDKPVSIPSDSNSEDEDNKRLNNKTNGKCDSPEIHEILSDKEDCVVIEDSVSPVKGMNSMERRQRKNPARMREVPSYDDDIEEIIEDPIAINSTTTIQPVMKKAKLSLPASTQLTLNDANGNRTDVSITPSTKGGQNSGKEPTVMFIDTQSILNNRNNSTNSRTATNSPGSLAANLAHLNKNSPGFSISPVTNTGQLNSSSNSPGTYPTNIKATITPINSKSTTTTNSNSNTKASSATPIQQLPSLSATQANGGSNILLPALTDDMFVLEAPSFIVPYIYEKPPSENLKTLVGAMGVELAEQKKKSGHGGGQHTDKDSDGEKIKMNASGGVANKEQGQQEAGKRDEEGGDGKKKKKSRKGKNPDDSWDESDTSTDEEASDSETRTKVLIKEVNPDIESIILPQEGGKAAPVVQETKQTNPDNYFESPLGNFFMSIGVNLVQEHVQTDLLRIQKRKQMREGNKPSAHVQTAINALMKNLEVSRNTNRPFKFSNKRCEFCNFKAESALIMANHYEKPHLKGNNYRCNFCTFEARPAHDILFHMEAVHNVKSKLDKPLCYHQCPNCPFEDNGKSKLARHTLACAKKFMPETNLTPPPDWDPPAKIPRIKPRHGLVGTATAYQAMAAQQQRINAAAAGIMNRMNLNNLTNVNNINTNTIGLMNNSNLTNLNANATGMTGTTSKGRGRNSGGGSRAGGGGNRQGSMRPQITPDMMQNYNHLAAAAVKHLSNSQLMQMAANQAMLPNTHNSLTIQTSGQGSKSSKNMQQPSISITPLPRGGASVPALQAAQAAALKSGMPSIKPGQHPSGSKSTFVICEICDGYIKDLDQLRSHMQLIHKVKIHPKMIYNRPPLNCQKCQYRFFTDQGLERHLLGSHGLVTSSMQEAANCGQDSGRCPVCGRVYQWKLLNHVSRDHNMTLKPAHLSYKCTVCTATFGMYKQFENHVYSAHSTVAKKSGDSKRGSSSTSSSSNNNSSFGGSSKNSGDAILKPLKINDEITIIPQPPTKASMTKTQTIEIE